MKVLVTGSSGFIGKNLISHLQEINNLMSSIVVATVYDYGDE